MLPPNYSYERRDAAETIFVERALTFVETETYNTEFPPLEGRKYVPVDTSAPPGAKFASYRQFTRTGIAKLVTERGQDLPTVKLYSKEFNHQFYRLGCSYEYTLDDLLAAQFSASNGGGSLNIDLEHSLAAREAIERGLDAIAGIGSATSATIPGLSQGVGPDVGLLGLLNQPNASTYVPATGAAGSTAWSQKTADERLADLSGMFGAMEAATYKVFTPTTILLPITQYRMLAGARMGDGSDESVITMFNKFYPRVTIDSWQYCQGAGTNGTDRAVAFISDKRRIKHMISEEFRQMPAQYEDLEFSTDCLAKTAGVFSAYPLSIIYMDGI